jgi:DNA-binding protein Fis
MVKSYRQGGRLSSAANWLGVSRPTIREKLKRYGLRSMPDTGAIGGEI